MVDSLAQKYNDNVKALDDRITVMKAENHGLVSKAQDAIAGTVQTIMEMKNMLMGVLAKAVGAIDKIIKDPIGFLGHLVEGLKQGFMKFMGNIWEHLKKGLMAFLTGALGGAGITMPESITDIKGIFSMVMGILGLTYEFIRARAVDLLGEKVVGSVEKVFKPLAVLVTQGIGGLWQFVQEEVGDLKAMVIDTIQSFIVDSVIKSGIMWVLSLLNPASAFVRACKAIYDIIMFFVERGSQIVALVNAVTDSVAAIANGAVGGAATLVEGALEQALPVVIGFLSSLLGLGGISEKIQGIINKVRSPITKAIDKIIGKASKIAKGLGNKFKGTKLGSKATAVHGYARQKQEAAHQWINDHKEAGKQHIEDKKEALKQGILDKKDWLGNNKLVKKLAAADQWASKKMTSLHNKWDAVKNWPGKKLEALGEKAGGLWGTAKDKFKQSKFSQKLGGMWKSVKDWGSYKWDATKNKFKQSKGGAIIGGTRNLAQQVMNLWQVRKQFRTNGGETHSLFIKSEGRQAQLMLASDEQLFSNYLKSLSSTQVNTPEKNLAKQGAITIYGQIESFLNELKTMENNFGIKRNSTQRGELNRKKEELLNQFKILSKYISILGIENTRAESVQTTIEPVSGLKLSNIKAFPLTALQGNTKGHPNAQLVKDVLGWSFLDKINAERDNDKTIYDDWVRLHLIHSSLHGPAEKYNLVAAPRSINTQIYNTVEEKAIRAILNPGTLLYYKVAIEYKNQKPPENDFPTALKYEWGRIKKGSSGKFEEDEKLGEVNFNTIQPPRSSTTTTGPSTIVLKNMGRPRMERLKFKQDNAKRIAAATAACPGSGVFAAMDQYYNEVDSIFLNGTHYREYLQADKEEIKRVQELNKETYIIDIN